MHSTQQSSTEVELAAGGLLIGLCFHLDRPSKKGLKKYLEEYSIQVISAVVHEAQW